MSWILRAIAPAALLTAVFAAFVAAQIGKTSAAAAAANATNAAVAPPFDVKAAVDEYLAKVPREQRVRSDAYFEGGDWLILWDFAPRRW
jgi:STE24 endopeptidase